MGSFSLVFLQFLFFWLTLTDPPCVSLQGTLERERERVLAGELRRGKYTMVLGLSYFFCYLPKCWDWVYRVKRGDDDGERRRKTVFFIGLRVIYI